MKQYATGLLAVAFGLSLASSAAAQHVYDAGTGINGTVHDLTVNGANYPAQPDDGLQRICIYCQAKDNFDPIRLSDKTGKVFTFSMDQRAQEIVLPKVFTVVNLDEGGRFYSVMTDRDTAKVAVGMPVEMTFRIQMGPSEALPLEGSGL